MIVLIFALSAVFRYKSLFEKRILSLYSFYKEKFGFCMIIKILFQFCERFVILLSFPRLNLCCQYHNMILQENALSYL